MTKLYKTNLINVVNFGLQVLAMFIFGMIITPAQSFAACGDTGCNYSYRSYTTPLPAIRQDNPVPLITSINPNSSETNGSAKTITITGEGFVPESIARVNGSNRPTTFIDDSHLLMQVTGNDISIYRASGGFFVTVWNGAPGGGFSNSAFFTISDTGAVAGAQTNTNANASDNSNLVSTAIYGSHGFLPSGIIQWIIFAIVILLIVILVRRAFGGRDKYQSTPLKHD